MNAKDLLEQLLEDKKYYPAHVKLTESIGVLEALVLQQHIFYQSHSGKQYYGIRKRIFREFRLSIRTQRKIEKFLVSMEFLTVNTKATTSYNYYTVDVNYIEQFIGKSIGERLTLVDKGIAKEQATADNSYRGGSNEPSLGGSNETSRIVYTTDTNINKTVLDKSNTTGSTESCNNEGKSRLMSKDEPVKKSRLNNKDIPTPVEEKEEPVKSALEERTNIANGTSRPIPKKTLQCIEYWNRYPELSKTLLDQGNRSKSVKYITRLMGHFFNGTFLDVVKKPKGFKDHKWFEQKPTFDDFCDIVDDFVLCVKSPDIQPINNGHKYGLLEFLQGNQFVKNKIGGIPSMMLKHCFGEYETVLVDKHPDKTKAIKDMWNKHIGKYHDTPSTEKAFVMASNISVTRFEEKREKESGWIPAMNDYKAEGIVRQILLDKAEWFKKEKKTPEIMSSGFFTGTIRRYDYDEKTGSMVL